MGVGFGVDFSGGDVAVTYYLYINFAGIENMEDLALG